MMVEIKADELARRRFVRTTGRPWQSCRGAAREWLIEDSGRRLLELMEAGLRETEVADRARLDSWVAAPR